jgi:hypothetical protein
MRTPPMGPKSRSDAFQFSTFRDIAVWWPVPKCRVTLAHWRPSERWQPASDTLALVCAPSRAWLWPQLQRPTPVWPCFDGFGEIPP